MATAEILVDDAFDVDPFVLADLPFDAYYPLSVGPALPQAVGGIGLPHPRRMPFWDDPACPAEDLAREAGDTAEAQACAEEDELGSDENHLLGLL
jgi:hypothetical protein